MRTRVAGALLAALLAACGSEEAPEGTLRGVDQATLLEALEGQSPILRGELVKTCEKWRHQTDEPCVPEAVRADALDCWLEKGVPTWEFAKAWGPWSRDRRILREVNICMEKRRWVKVRRGPDF